MDSLQATILFYGSFLVAGCAIPTKVVDVAPSIARDLPPVAIAASIGALDDPVNQLRIEQLLASPQVRDIERELARGLVDASVAALGDDARIERIGALTSRYAAAMVAGLVNNTIPQVAATLGQAAGNQGNIGSALANAVARDLGPSLQRVLADNVGPGIAGALEKEEVLRALSSTARMLGREVVLGIDEGMAEIQSKKPKSEPTVLGSVGALAQKGADLASGVTWVLAAVVLVLGGLLLKLVMQARKYRSESEQREATTRVLDEARRASVGKPWSEELIGALEEQLRGTRPADGAARLPLPRAKPPPTNCAGHSDAGRG